VTQETLTPLESTLMKKGKGGQYCQLEIGQGFLSPEEPSGTGFSLC
jgi:hypothetical protein